jgi:hypothetical protein
VLAVWILFFVPIVFSGITWYFYNHKVAWWELIVPTMITFLLIFVGNKLEEKVLISDVEYLNGFVTEVNYYEDWNEYIEKTCSSESCSGSGDSQTCVTNYYDCSYVQYHSEEWEALTTFGTNISINKSQYSKLVKQFGNESFKDLRRDYHTNDGDMYISKWDWTKMSAEPYTITKNYDNRVQASHSIFNLPEITDQDIKTLGLIDYPKFVNHYQQNYVIGVNDEVIQKEYRYLNSLYGKKKQIVLWVMVVQGKPRDWAYMQEAYWDGGNKNEATAIINIKKDGTVDWVYVMSWTEREDFKHKLKTAFPQGERLDLLKAQSSIADIIDKRWFRKSFHDFDYIQIDFPIWYIVFMYFLVIGGNVFMALWIINDEKI